MKLGKILGTVAGVAGAATGNPWIGAAGQLLGGLGGEGKYTPPKTGWRSLEEIFGSDFTNRLEDDAKASYDLPRAAPAFRPFTSLDTGDTSVFRPNAAIALAGWDAMRKMAQQGQQEQNRQEASGANGDAIMGLMKLQELAGAGGMYGTKQTQPWEERRKTMSLADLADLGGKLKNASRMEGAMSGAYMDRNSGRAVDLSSLLQGRM